MYKVSMEEARWGAVSPGDEWSIPMIDADFLCFTSKPVHISPNLPLPSQVRRCRHSCCFQCHLAQ